MQLTIYKTNVDATASLLDYIDTKMSSSLERMADHIDDITIRIADLNGPRGGEDKRCTVSVTLASKQTTLIAETDSCMYKAVDKVCSRLKRSIRRRVRRTFQSHRRNRLVKY